MARIIDFYTPENYRRKTAPAVPPSQPGKVIVFRLQSTKLA